MKHHLSAILAFAVFTAAGGELQRANLKFEERQNISISDSIICIPSKIVQVSEGAIKIEAENFAAADLQRSDKRIESMPDASRNFAVSYAKMLRYELDITSPGKYQIYFRAKFPLVAFWNHTEVMNDGTAERIVDSDCRPANIWIWYSGMVYELQKGKNIWTFSSPGGWCGGAVLDSMVLMPEKMNIKPEDVNDKLSKLELPATGQAVSRRIKLQRIASWQLDFVPVPHGGRIVVEYSYDGESFFPVEAGKIYDTVNVRDEYLYFKINMETAKDAHISPFIYNLRFSIQRK